MSTKTATINQPSRRAGQVERLGMILAAGQFDTLVGILTRPETDGRAFLDTVRR